MPIRKQDPIAFKDLMLLRSGLLEEGALAWLLRDRSKRLPS